MNCPKCGGEQHCPCNSCKKRNKGKITWVWVTENGPISCGHCGHTMPIDEWEELDYKEFKRQEALKKEIS